MALYMITRSQKTAIGHLRAGMAVEFDESDAAHKKVLERLLDKKFVEKTTKKKLEDAKIKAETLAAGPRDKDADLAPVVAGLESKLVDIARASGDFVKAREAFDAASLLVSNEEDEAKAAKLQEKADKLVAAVDERAGTKYSGRFDKFSRWEDARDAIDYWAARARVRLAELSGR